MIEIDRFDRRILSALQEDSRQTGEQLSEKIGLSPAACLRRRQRLRQIGAIEREVAIVSPAFQPKAQTRVVVTVTVAKHNLQRATEFTRDMAAREEVQQVLSVAGEDDLVLLMAFPSVEAFSDFADEHFSEAPVEGFQSRFVLRDLSRAA